MAVSTTFTPEVKKKKFNAQMGEDVLHELELFLECASEEHDWLTMDKVAEQLLLTSMSKDRGFTAWKKQRAKAEKNTQAPTQEPMSR